MAPTYATATSDVTSQTLRSFEQVASQKIEAGKLPGFAVAITDSKGELEYQKCFGYASLEDNGSAMTLDTTLSLASSTKLVTAVASMQMVEAGLVDLDEDLGPLLPELRSPYVLKGYDIYERAILEKSQNSITLRTLLSNTSGLAYFENPRILKYLESINSRAVADFKEYFISKSGARKDALAIVVQDLIKKILTVYPLMFDPGNGWSYGPGVDFAGKLVEYLSGMSLEDYCQRNIFRPLGMHHTSFRMNQPHIKNNLATMYIRSPDGNLSPTHRLYVGGDGPDIGGVGLCSTVQDYMKLLTSLLRNTGVLLRPSTVEVMLSSRLPDRSVVKTKDLMVMLKGFAPIDGDFDHCLAGLVNCQSFHTTGRSADTVSWFSTTSTFWFIDRRAGIAGFYGSQIMNAGDKGISRAMYCDFEKAIYDHLRSQRAKL